MEKACITLQKTSKFLHLKVIFINTYFVKQFLCRSFIDLNRAGIPLMEFVFEPDLSDGEEAAALVKELILILQRLNACSCKMAGNSIYSNICY